MLLLIAEGIKPLENVKKILNLNLYSRLKQKEIITNQFKYNLNKLRRVLNFIAYYIPCKLRIESEFGWISAGNAQTIKRISGHQIRLRKNHKFSLNKHAKSNIHTERDYLKSALF